ncbi:hypothetical protein OAJ35_05020 [Gammaproteobacteria bacterium]|nr:hypothetical protein [Gammaproteobacteria bacterium]
MLWLLIQWILFLVLFLALGYLTSRIILWFWSLLKEIMNPPTSEKNLEPDSYEEVSHDSQDN